MHLQARAFRSIATLLSFFLTFSLIPMVPVAAAAETTYYVAKSGSDANPGTAASPWRTIQKAANTAVAGDHVLIKAGTYSEAVTFSKSGTAGAKITFDTYQNDRVVLDQGLKITGNHYVVNDLEFITTGALAWPDRELTVYGDRNTINNPYLHDARIGRSGIQVGKGGDDASYNVFNNIRLIKDGLVYINDGGSRGNVFKGGEIGYSRTMLFRIGGFDNVVDGLDLHDPGQIGTGGNESDGFNIHGKGHVIRNSRIYNIFRMVSTQHTDAFQWWGGPIDDITIENNIIGSSARGGLRGEPDYGHIQYEGTTNRIIIRNNLFLGTGVPYVFNTSTQQTVQANDWQINNNVFRTTHKIRDNGNARNWQVKNNVFYADGVNFTNGANYSVDGNLYVNGARKSSWDGSKSKEAASAAFVKDDISSATQYGLNADFRPRPGSPMIDAGVSSGAPLLDKDGNPRYDDPSMPNTGGGTYPYYDIGAYEYQGAGGSQPDTTPPQISGAQAANITPDSARISWITDESANSQLEYGTDTGYGSTTALDSAYVTNHAQLLSGLAPDTTYHYRVKSTDYSGNSSVSGDRSFTTAAIPEPGEYEYIQLEGENGSLTSPMTQGSDPQASEGGYAYSPLSDTGGVASYDFTNFQAGNYTVWGRVIAPDSAHDSFLASMDSAVDDVWDVISGERSADWKWDRVSLRGAGTFDAAQFDPKTFYLASGSHTLRFKAREANTLLDQIVITNDPDYVPGTTGEPEPADTTDPVTTLSTNPSSADGVGGWFKTQPEISLARDEAGTTYYQWGSTTGTWKTYQGSFAGREGQDTLYYYSVDDAGNQEATKEASFKVDTVSPLGSTVGSLAAQQTESAFAVSWSGSDGSGSGISTYDVQYNHDGSGWQNWLTDTALTTAVFTSPAGDGTYGFRVRAKDQAGNVEAYQALPSASTVVDTTLPSDQYEYIQLEGENGSLTSPMTQGSDPQASAGGYAYSPLFDSGAVASYDFTNFQAGNYTVWGRAIAPDSAHDSFLVSMDSAVDDAWDVLSGESSADWKWDRVSLRGAGTFDAAQFDPKTFYLASGSHTLRFKAREANTLLDQIVITNDPDYVPGTTGEPGPSDTTDPDSTLSTNPSSADGAGGWFKTQPEISLARDEAGTTYYQWGSTTGTWETYQGSFAGREGQDTLYYYSVDDAGNQEAIKEASFKVDTVSPIGSTVGALAAQQTESFFAVSWSGSDGSGSGISTYDVQYNYNGGGWQNGLIDTALTTSVFTSPSGDGTYGFRVRAKDQAGNVEAYQALPSASTVVDTAPAEPVDTVLPTGSITIKGGAAHTRSKQVQLSLPATDGEGSGLDQMRLSNDGVFDDTGVEGWAGYSAAVSWTLSAGEGDKRVYVQFKDAADNKSAVYSDQIFLDEKKPGVTLTAPAYSTKESKTATFKISWSATDPVPASGVESYTVRYRPANSSTWTDWKVDTKSTSASFAGSAGRTYFFRVSAKDKAGNVGWSSVKRTVVPYNEGSLLKSKAGFKGFYSNAASEHFLGTVRYSKTRNNKIVYKFTGKSLALISVKGPDRSKAKIYVDGVYVKTIDNYAAQTSARQIVFDKTWEKSGTHHLKIVNLGTPGRSRFDVDGLGVGR